MDLTILLVLVAFLVLLVPTCGFFWGFPGALGVALLVGFFFLVFGAGRSSSK